MGAAAQLHRVAVKRVGLAADLDHANRVAVFVAKKLQDAVIAAHLAVRRLSPAHDGVVDDALVDQLLDVGQLLRRQRRAVEIKRQLIRADMGTLLRGVRAGDLVQRPVEKMRDRVVALYGGTAGGIHRQLGLSTNLRHTIALDEMQESIAGLLRAGDSPCFAADRQRAGIADLAAHLSIKRRSIKYDAGAFLFLNDLRHGGGGAESFKADKLRRRTGGEARDTDDLLFLRGPCAVALLLHQRVETGVVHRQAGLTRHQLRKIQRKAIRVIKLEGKLAGQLFFISHFSDFFVEEVDAAVEGFVERLLLGTDGFLDDFAALFQLGENVSHRVRQHIDELVKKRLVKPERAPVAHGAAQDAAQNVVAIGVPRLDAVGNRETQRADVVADDSKGGVGFFLPGLPGAGQRGGVFFAAQFLELGEDGTENVGVIIGNRPAEVGEAVGGLHDGGDTLEAHPGVHVPGGERHERAVRVGVVLDENQIPNLYALSAVGVDEAALRVALRGEVDVQLATRAARAGVAHHPEIILLVAIDDVHGGVEPGGGKDRRPTVVRLLVELAWLAFARLVHGGVEPLFRKPPHAGE